MITDETMRHQVREAMADQGISENAVRAAVDEIQSRYGTIDIDQVPSDEFWTILIDAAFS